MQIKNINEFLNLNNNNISTDRIMICPSCENKISNNQNISKSTKEKNDSKNYRMGQGFSHMLQLINSDLMKSAEKILRSEQMKIILIISTTKIFIIEVVWIINNYRG